MSNVAVKPTGISSEKWANFAMQCWMIFAS